MSLGPPEITVVGAGPNGLAAAITLARAGRRVRVLEAADQAGGGTRSEGLTLPGFVHDVCSAIHPLGVASPFFRGVPLADHGLEWLHPPAAVAHPLDDGTAAVLARSVTATGQGLGRDGMAWGRLYGPLVADWRKLMDELLGPFRIPRHPIAMARFGPLALLPASVLVRLAFREPQARALFSGLAAHSIMPLHWPASGAFGLLLGTLGHAVGWPVARGGSQQIANALVAYLRSLGGEVVTGAVVASIDELPSDGPVLLDVTPRQVLRLAGHRLSGGYRRRLAGYRYGAGVFKVDWALDGLVPWRAAVCSSAATVHLGGTFEEVVAAEAEVGRGEHPERPFVLFAQQSLFDDTRAPAGKHTAWAYCHVPNGSSIDMTERIEQQVERFAPGFRDRILARHSMGPADMERHNPNYVGGDINGGVQDLRQLYTRPMLRAVPYRTSAPDLYICSSSTPPGGGVHGMCGYHAANAVLRRTA